MTQTNRISSPSRWPRDPQLCKERAQTDMDYVEITVASRVGELSPQQVAALEKMWKRAERWFVAAERELQLRKGGE